MAAQQKIKEEDVKKHSSSFKVHVPPYYYVADDEAVQRVAPVCCKVQILASDLEIEQ
ncbi:MAG: hypothetical protein E7F86_10005 [Veillonella sp.]|uniref:hypothetical protein n=1 Tax=Veillonella sp. TaxID=1926307 RepID=UPI0029102E1A|nr:hypothetical protein [Veillonella sp.]MDU3565369.1 hypothetical protein [Veillonella sp.]